MDGTEGGRRLVITNNKDGYLDLNVDATQYLQPLGLQDANIQ